MIPKWLNEIRYGAAHLYAQGCHLISPPFCVDCRRFLDERIPLCADCEQRLEPIASLELKINRAYTMRVFALTHYTGIVRKLTIAKYYRQPLPSRQLGELVARGCYCPWENFDYIIPVPLHWSRYTARGFNQAAEMAKRISQLRGIPFDDGLKRIRRTTFQAGLSAEKRQDNVAHACILRPGACDRYASRHLLIVDDVMTTGATLQEIARILTPCKPASITAVVGARVL